MKPLRKHLKLIALLLSFAVLMQNCAIYKSRVSTVEAAVQSNKRVKIVSNNHPPYKFKHLFMVEEKLYGLTQINTKTADLLKDQIVSESNNPTHVQIELSKEKIGKIHVLKYNGIMVYFGIQILLLSVWFISGQPDLSIGYL